MPTFTAPDGSPITLTPGQQAQALQLAAAPVNSSVTQPAAPVSGAPAANPTAGAVTFTKPDGTPVTLTPEQQQTALQQAQQPSKFSKPDGTPLDPVHDLTAEQLAAMNEQAPDSFSLTGTYNALPPESRTPDVVQKLADAHDIVSNRKIYQDLPSAGTVLSNIWGMAKGAGQLIANTAKGAALVAGGYPGHGTWMDPAKVKEVQRGVAEGWSGTESAVSGLADQIANVFTKENTHPTVPVRVSTFGGPIAPDETPEQIAAAAPQRKVDNFLTVAAQAEQQSKILAGKGEFMQAAGGSTLDDLAKAGYPVRPEEAAKLAAVDPFSWYVFGKAFDAVAPATKAVIPAQISQSIAAVSDAAANVVKQTVGGTAKLAASALSGTGKALEKSAPFIGRPIAAVAGAVHAGVPGAVTGLVFGKGMTESLEQAGKKIAAAAKGTAQFGEGVSGEAATGPVSQLAKDVIEAAPGVAQNVAIGAALDVGLQGATAETPEQKAGFAPIGTMLGGLHGAMSAGKWILGGALAGERNWGATAGVPNSAAFPQLNQLHNAAMSTAVPKIQERVRAIQQLKQGVAPNTDVFYVPPTAAGAGEITEADAADLGQQRFDEASKSGNRRDIANLSRFTSPDGTKIWTGSGEPNLFDPADPNWKTVIPDALETALQNTQGGEARAWQAGQSNGVFLKGMVGADGKTRNALIFRKVGAAPHEAVHAMDVALGANRVAELNQAAKQDYGDEWDKITQRYAEALNDHQPLPQGTAPGDLILDRSGFGEEAARNKNGGDGADWQTALTPEEKQAEVDRYVGGEVRAENGDAYFKRVGPKGDMGFAGKLASAAAELVSLLGGEPLAGRYSQGLGFPLKWSTFKRTGATIEAAKNQVPPAARPTRTGPLTMTGVPTTPAQIQQAADDARTIAAQQPEEKPPGEGEQSAKEALGNVADAIASQSPVRYQYRGAAGETPTGGALETDVAQRQAEIEAARNVPESVRNLFERVGFPYKVEMSGKGPQVLDWAPVNLAANAFRWAKSLSELARRNPNAPELLRNPYPLDVAKGEFTPEGWRQLFQDAQKYTQNQLAGFGGAGQPLIVPAELGAANVFAPPRTSAEAPANLSQDRSDFINMLYGERPPETPRVSRKSGVPLNVIAQKVSAATEPGRIVEPAKIRAKPKQAAGLGIEPGSLIERAPFKEPILGVPTIQEVNPTRGALETALQSAGIEIPKMTKVIRKLNLEHIHSVQPEPNLPRTAGANVLTTTAGFLPKDLKLSFEKHKITGEGMLRVHGPKGEVGRLFYRTDPNNFSARITDVFVSPQFRKQGVGEYLYKALADRLKTEGIRSVEGAPVHPAPLRIREKVFGNVSPQNASGEVTSQLMPVSDFLDRLDRTSPEEWANMVHNYQGKYGGGQTGLSVEVGAGAKSPEEVAALQSAIARQGELMRGALKNKDFQDAANFASKSQAAREAYEAATGGGGIPDFMQRYHPEANFQAPFPENAINTADTAQFAPAKSPEEAKQEPKTILIRHGSTKLNDPNPDKDRIRGHMDIPLSEEGHQQAKELGQQLKSSGIRRIYASDLGRTMDTAKEIAKTTGAPITPDPRLRPWNFGPTIEGKPTSDMLPKIAELAKNPDTRPPKGETFNEYKNRFLNAYHDIQNGHPNENTAIVTHYRGTKLMDAWRAAGVDNDNIEPSVFEEYDKDKKPGSFNVMDKRGNLLPHETAHQGPITHISDEELNSAPGLTKEQTDALQKQPGPFPVTGAQFKPREEKEIELRHWSNVPGLKVLDPAFHGTGLSGDERIRQRDYADIYVPRTYFGTKDYAKEPGLGPEEYRAAVQKNKLYPFQEDPKDLWPTPEEVEQVGYAPMDFRAANTLYENKIAKAGYEGYIHRDAKVAAKFTKTPVKYIGQAQYAPSSDPRAIRAAAVRDPETGEIHEGPMHLSAYQAATAAGVKSEDLSKMSEGFVTNEGEFLDRQKASERAQEMGQITYPKGYVPSTFGLVSEELAAKPAAPAQPAQFRPAGAPKLEDFQDEGKIAKALSRPGWALLTATEEKKGPGTAPVNVKANSRLEDRLKELGYDFVPVAGSYKGIDQGQNFLVTGISPQDALALGKEFNQESVLTPHGLVYQDGSVHPAKPEETVVGAKAKKNDFYSQVKGGPAFSMGIDFDNKIAPESAPSPVARPEQQMIGGEFSPTKELAPKELTPTELREHYPEAVVVPDRAPGKPAGVPSAITDSPLYKEAGNREQAEDVFAKRLADFARQYEDNPAYKDGLRWYSEFAPMLKRDYGKDSPIMAELLAATSPQNNPTQNFAMANDALEMWKRGKFDKQLKKFAEGIDKLKDGSWKESGAPTEAKFMSDWIDQHDLKPRQSNGKLYNMHSVPVLQVLARQWLENTGGPKTQNFVKNLLGTGHGATYDVWADRTLRRIGYSGHQARWRILPKNAIGVSDADFAFGQKVFSKAAKDLGVRPDSLQGALWFAEKQLWADNGWGRLDLGDFRKEIQNRELLNRGIAQRLAATEAAAQAPKAEQSGFDLGIIEPRPTR